MRQNRVLIWIDGHIPSRVIGFFPTDWIQENALHGHRIGYVRVSSFDQKPDPSSAPWSGLQMVSGQT